MISRRSFLQAMVAQPLLLSSPINQVPNLPQFNVASQDSSEFVIIGGWVFLKSDLLKLES